MSAYYIKYVKLNFMDCVNLTKLTILVPIGPKVQLRGNNSWQYILIKIHNESNNNK